MAQRDTNQTGHDSKGKPSDTMQDKAETKTIRDKEELEREEKIREKYTDGENNPDPDVVHVSNPNRNTDKVNNNTASYS